MKNKNFIAMFSPHNYPKNYSDKFINDTLKRIGFGKNCNQKIVVKSVKYIINDYSKLRFNEKNKLERLIKREIEKNNDYRGTITLHGKP